METRALLPKGRGNVYEDIEKSNFESWARMRAARNLSDHLLAAFDYPNDKRYEQYRTCLPDEMIKNAAESGCSRQQIRELVFKSSKIASAIYLQAGNCFEYESISGYLHSDKLSDTKVSLENYSLPAFFDHAWMEERETDRKPRTDDLMIDGWSEGSAVLREDYRFAGRENDSNWSGFSWPLISQGISQILAKIRGNPARQQVALREAAQLQRHAINKEVVLVSGFFNASSISTVSDKFIRKVQQARKEKSSKRARLLTEIEAAGVLSSFGLNVRSATHRQDIRWIMSEMEKVKRINTGKENANCELNKKINFLN